MQTQLEEILPKLPGFCTIEKGKRLEQLAFEAPEPSQLIEIGVYGGRSLIALGMGLKRKGGGFVIGIDPYKKSESDKGSDNGIKGGTLWENLDYDKMYTDAFDAIFNVGLKGFAGILRKSSIEVIDDFENEEVDILHQDGNHSTEISSKEVEIWTPKIRKGGLWIMDDTNWPSLQKAQTLIVQKGFTMTENHGWWKVFRKAM